MVRIPFIHLNDVNSSSASVEFETKKRSRCWTALLVVLFLLLLTSTVVFVYLWVKERKTAPCNAAPFYSGSSHSTMSSLTTSNSTTSDSTTSNSTTSHSTPCNSATCVMDAPDILRNMNASADPCKDFYEYSCGGFERHNHIPDDSPLVSNSFSSAQNAVLYGLRDLLANYEVIPNYLQLFVPAVDKAVTFYKSCIGVSRIEDLGVKPMLNLVEDLGSWTITNKKWSGDSWLLEKVLANVYKNVGIGSFIAARVGRRLTNYKEKLIQIGVGSTGLGLHLHDLEYLNSEKEKKIQAYKNYMITVFKLLGANGATKSTLDDDVNQILNLESSAVQVTDASDRRKMIINLGYGHPNVTRVMTLAELEIFTYPSAFNWRRYLKEVFRDTGKTIDSDREIIVSFPNDVKKMVDLISSQNKRVLANAIMWNTVASFIDTLPKSIRDAADEVFEALNGLKATKSRWKKCVAKTDSIFGYATTSMYVKKFLPEKTRQRAQDLFLEIKREFTSGLNEQTWMDSETRSQAHQKIEKMRDIIAYSSSIIDDVDRLNKIYQHVIITKDDLFHTVLSIRKLIVKGNLNELEEEVEKQRFGSSPLTVNAFYSPVGNFIYILTGILHRPFYGGGRLEALNYGSLGAVVGHEITHGFDASGSQFDADGNLRKWWTPRSTKAFKKKQKCMIDEYSREMVFGRKVNGLRTLSENIADNGGIKYAFRAYEKWRDSHGSEAKLPGLNFSNDQLFFISYAQTWCVKYREQAIDYLMKSDTHSLNPVRVRVPLRNFKKFHAAFGCKVPKDTCTVW